MAKKVVLDNDYAGGSLRNIERLAALAVNKAMERTIPQALKEHNDQEGIMEEWFKKKFYDDVSDIRPESPSLLQILRGKFR